MRIKKSIICPRCETSSFFVRVLNLAGSLEAAFSILALRDGVVPHTLNLATPEPACGFTFVKTRPVGGVAVGVLVFDSVVCICMALVRLGRLIDEWLRSIVGGLLPLRLPLWL